MDERKGIVTMQGNPLTLLGKELKTGDEAPDFTVVSNDLSPVGLSAYKGKTLVISSGDEAQGPAVRAIALWL